jgi:NADPH2:quinone reductase
LYKAVIVMCDYFCNANRAHMRAITLKQFGGTDQFELREVPMPGNPDGNVLVQIKASAFNPIDFQMRLGLGESKLSASPILGREMSGVVADPGTSEFKKGDAVFAYVGSKGSNGTYAEYVSVPQDMVALIPGNISFLEAAAIPMVSMTALQCVERMGARPNESVLITGGAGGVGSVLIQLLQLSGIDRLVSFAGNDSSRKALFRFGLSEASIIDYRSGELPVKARAANQGQDYDHCVDIVGGPMSELCAQLLKTGGSYSDIAFLGTKASREELFDKAVTVYNISNYAYASDSSRLGYYGEKLSYLGGLIKRGELLPPSVHSVGSMTAETVAEAHLLMEENRTNGQKIVMEIKL